MQITLNEDEIKDAIVNYVRGQINISDTQRVEVDLKAGRGDNGYSATLDIRPAAISATTSVPAPKQNFREPTRAVELPPLNTPETVHNVTVAGEANIIRGLKLAISKAKPQEAPGTDQVDEAVATTDVLAVLDDIPTGMDEPNDLLETEVADPVEEESLPDPEPKPAAVLKPTRSIFNIGK